MRQWLLLALLLLTTSAFSQEEAAYYGDHRRGWFWYEKAPPENVDSAEQQLQASVDSAEHSPIEKPLSPRERLKKQGEAWEDALASAILEPSPENYLAYLTKTAVIQEQSQKFAQGFKNTLWVTPEYDYTLEKPRDTQAIVGMNDKRNHENDTLLQALAKDNGLLFFFRGDCPHCHRFAPVLKLFAETFGFTVIPVSLDGGGLPEYPYPKSDHEMASKLNISTVPAIFMVNPENNAVVTVGYGYNNWVKLKEKVLFAAQKWIGGVSTESRQ